MRGEKLSKDTFLDKIQTRKIKMRNWYINIKVLCKKELIKMGVL